VPKSRQWRGGASVGFSSRSGGEACGLRRCSRQKEINAADIKSTGNETKAIGQAYHGRGWLKWWKQPGAEHAEYAKQEEE